MADLHLSDDQLNAVIAKSIFDTLTEKKRSELIAGALKALLGKKATDRYDAPTHLQAAFNDAVVQVAREIASEKVKTDPTVRAGIDKLYLDAWKRLVEGHETYEKLVEKLSYAFEKALTGDRY